MFEVNIFSVVAATFLAIAVGIVWYSPWAFGKQWMRMVGLPPEAIESMQDWRKIVVGAVLQFTLFYCIGTLLEYMKGSSLNIFIGLIAGIALALAGSSVVWERKPFAHLLITGGYTVTVLVIGIGVIARWPW